MMVKITVLGLVLYKREDISAIRALLVQILKLFQLHTLQIAILYTYQN